tara:strand:+ start:437 stop:2395 length:1959 start_codon:yes stop_codon:yes gene_type:complete
MPIEDIDFLYQNSTKESIILLIDSSKRDIRLNPNIAAFQITFDEPFTFVYGIEILDTTIPRTMFMVEEDINNELTYCTGVNSFQEDNERSVKLMSQDFSTSDILFDVVQFVFDKTDEVWEVGNNEIYYDQSVDLQNYYERSKSDNPILTLRTDKPFYLNMTKSNIYKTLGFSLLPTNDDNPKYNTLSNALSVPTNICKNRNESFVINFLNDTQVKKLENSNTFKYVHKSKVPEAYISNISITPGIELTIHDNENKLMRTFKSDEDYNNIDGLVVLRDIEYTFTLTSDSVTLEVHFVEFLDIKHIVNDVIYLSIPNIDAHQELETSLNLTPDNASGYTYELDLQSLSSTNLSFDNVNETFLLDVNNVIYKYKYITIKSISIPYGVLTPSDDKSYIKLEITDNNSNFIMDIFLRPQEDTNELKYSISEDDDILRTNMSKKFFNIGNFPDEFNNLKYNFELKTNNRLISGISSCKIKWLFVGSNQITSPGMINLASENYVLLRCDEIENHLRGSFNSEKYTPGLGVLNIGVQGYAEGNNEFFSVKYKEFHPIGRLTKMSFRFERKSDRKLYNFKHIDLHFLLSIKFLRPFSKNVFERSILNPEYDSNFIKYINNTNQNEEPSSDEEDDIFDRDEYVNQYNERENYLMRYMDDDSD